MIRICQDILHGPALLPPLIDTITSNQENLDLASEVFNSVSFQRNAQYSKRFEHWERQHISINLSETYSV